MQVRIDHLFICLGFSNWTPDSPAIKQLLIAPLNSRPKPAAAPLIDYLSVLRPFARILILLIQIHCELGSILDSYLSQMVSGKKRKCTCGCEKSVTAQTERNHLKGRTTPLIVKTHNAARRLAVLGLSPGRRRAQAKKSALLSPRKARPPKGSAAETSDAMDVDADADGGDPDILPQFYAEGSGAAPDRDGAAPLDMPGLDIDPGIDIDVDGDLNQGPAVDPELYDPAAAADLRQATAAAREGVWSNGHRVTIDEEDDLDETMYMDADLDSEADGAGPEGEDDFWGDEDQDYDEYEWLYGLPVGDIVEEEMERELAQFGKSIFASSPIFINDYVPAEELSEDDLAILRAFAFKTEEHLTNTAFKKLPYTFPDANIQTLKLPAAATLVPTPMKRSVHIAKSHAFKSDGRPRKTFTYVPLIPRLVAYFKNAEMVDRMSYRGDYKPDADMKDVFDSANYRILRDRFVTTVLLRSSAAKKTCWPLILFNYNLPPEIRFHLKHILCVGVIPGPKKPQDADSFLWPLIEELLKLELGVSAFDISASEKFALRAYLTTVFGDIPAISMIMRMKGHNGRVPCRMCNIVGLPGTSGTTHYLPLDRSSHPAVVNTDGIRTYDPLNLPMRTHDEILDQAREVQFAGGPTEKERLSKQYGIKGVPILSSLSSIFFPLSFPYDFMHLIYENVVKNLVLLWTGNYKGLDTGTGSYELQPKVWEAIGAATAAAGSTIPTAFGARPPDVSKDRTACTADTWSFWLLYLGPVLLHRKFEKRIYYDHFIEFVKLVNTCLQFKYTPADIASIRAGFAKWVLQYEKLYYQNSPDRLSACPLTIHVLLHIADGIEAAGPVWAYWAFPMERFCGRLQPCIKSRRYPFASIDGHVVSTAQLSIIKVKHSCEDQIRLGPPERGLVAGAFAHPSYPSCILLPPRHISQSLSKTLATRIAVSLATRYDTHVSVIKRYLEPLEIEQWAKVERLNGGDRMLVSSMLASLEDRRDATYVRYTLLVDQNARHARLAPRFIPVDFYGQLQNIFVVKLPPADELNLTEETTHILAAVTQCEITAKNDLDMHYYHKEGPLQVVDITTLQCVVGRVKTTDKRHWVIIDRSGSMARAYYDPDD
ncbi:hypothetical protein MVEN_01393300 [Mycena venus]|uniref:Transposase family Tnp2 protein n=1 Tax=Mycena venus TaxID=2733690 RepID=A0A8H6XYR6_9AGAR|nr:hypothetical protein MVEN_01393300 [Mycena venus]